MKPSRRNTVEVQPSTAISLLSTALAQPQSAQPHIGSPTPQASAHRIKKIHWNVLTECNMHCAFCYLWRGSHEPTLPSAESKDLIKQISQQADWIAFGGGDPLMRKDLPELLALAKHYGLKTDLQTNGLLLDAALMRRIAGNLDRIGLSLDGDNASTHDAIRSYPGHFDITLSALQLCDEVGIPAVVRTMVCNTNLGHLAGVPQILSEFHHIEKWSLRQFVALGRGVRSEPLYGISHADFEREAHHLKEQCVKTNCRFPVAVISEDEMSRCYCLITPDGKVYTHPKTGDYVSVGQFPQKTLAEMLPILPYDCNKRQLRDSPNFPAQVAEPPKLTTTCKTFSEARSNVGTSVTKPSTGS